MRRSSPSGREVFEILARENADMLASYLRSLVRTPELADELFQQTLITAWQKLDTYDRERAFGPWLRGIAARLVLRQRERAGRELLNCDSEVMAAIEERFCAVSSTSEGFQGLVDRLRECLGRLPARLGEVVRLVYEQGLKVREAAARLGASEEAAKKRLQRGRARLADCMRDAPSPGGAP